MKWAAFVMMMLMAAGLQAQPATGAVSGHVANGATALANATVTLAHTGYIATTDSNGYFEFKTVAAGKYKLRANSIGYAMQEREVLVEPGKTTFADPILHPIAANLTDVVVAGSANALNKVPDIIPVEVIGAKEFVRNPVSNVFDALAYTKGIFCDIDQGLTNPVDINILGMEGSYSMFTIDGVPAMNNLAGIFALSAFPLSMVDNVQIEKGSNSTINGPDAIAGAINIITKDPATAPRLALNATLNSKLESELGLTTAMHLKKADGLFSLAADNMNYRWDINHDNFMDIPLVNRMGVYTKWNFKRKQNRLAVVYARYLFEDRFTGQMDAPGRIKAAANYYTQWLGTNQWQAGFKYQLPCREQFVLLADYSEHYQKALFDTARYSGTLRNAYVQLNWNKTKGIHHLTATATYRLRYYADNTGLSDVAITGIGYYVHTASVSLVDQMTINPHHTLFWGAGFDYSNLTGPVATPRINYKWTATGGHNIIYLGAGTGYRVPNLLNEGFTALETSRRIEVPEKLKTEYSVSLNLDYTHTQLFNMGSLKFTTGIFGLYLVNFTEPDYVTDSLAVIYNNSRGGGTMAAEAGIDWAFRFPLNIGGNFTYTYAFEVDRSGGEAELETPTHCPYFIANFYISYAIPQAQVTIDFTGNVISPMLLATVPNDYRPTHSPWYSITNIQLTRRFKKGIELFAGVKNLFNFVQQNPILRPDDPYNRYVNINNPNHYYFDNTYAYSTVEGIKGFVGFRYTLQ